MSRPVVLDNTVLSNFAAVRRADLVLRLWGEAVCTTPAAFAEYEAGVAGGMLSKDAWAGLSILTLSEEETGFAAGLSSRLGAGERTCLAVARHRQGLLVSDDLDARKVARQFGVSTTGTIGILVVCVQHDLLSRDEANALLMDLVAAGYRSPIDSVDFLLD
jgi:predicted nucleic acid-binding protein